MRQIRAMANDIFKQTGSSDLFFSLSPDLFCITSGDGIFMELNPAWESTLGYSIDEMIGKSYTDFLHPDDIVATNIQSDIQGHGQTTLNFINRYRAKDGSYKWLEWRGRTVGEENTMFDVARDITEWKKVEQTQRESAEKYRNIFENVQDTYYEASLAGEILELSPSVEVLTKGQYTRNDLIGKNLEDFYTIPEEREMFLAAIIKKGFIEDFELTLKNRDGSNVPCALSSKIAFDSDGRPEKICGNIRDITRRKKTEQQMAKQAVELLELNATKDKFFSIIAHDLRGPFGAFLNLTRIMVEDIHDMSLSKIQQFATIMSKSALNIFEMLENLLEWSRMQRGLTAFEPVRLVLNTRIVEFLLVLTDSANNKNITIFYDVPEDLEVYADIDMIESTLRNLVSNAIKFTKSGGRVTIAATQTDHESVVISVADTGIGMNKEIVKKLFRIDINVSRAGTDGESSSGLGLLLCKEFIEKHHGRIWVESEENKGSTFYFELPLKSEALPT